MKTTTHFKIRHGYGFLGGKEGNFSFNTAEEAIKDARGFKENPRSHNEDMSNESVKYWKEQTFTIMKETTITEEIKVI